MKILYVHGLGGETGGSLEKALRAGATARGHELLALRWETGVLSEMVKGTATDILLEYLTDRNPWRLAIRGILALERRKDHHWESGIAAITAATLRTNAALTALGRTGEAFSAVAFSLGCRVLLSALRSLSQVPENTCRAVFAGAAVSRVAFRALPSPLLEQRRIVNVYSEDDLVLGWLYEHVQSSGDPAGFAPVEVPGVTNVRVDVGHLSYPILAERLIDLATEP